MNVKTTLLLAFFLAVLGIAYLWRPQPQPTPPGVTPAPSQAPVSVVTRDLFDPPLGDVVKLVVTRKGKSDWVFEKQAEESKPKQYSWKMTAPQELTVDKYQIDRIERAISKLQYDVSFKPGSDGGMTADEAGLGSTATVVALTDDQGRTESVEIGKPESDAMHYVRVVGQDDIVVGKTSLRDLIKGRPIDYRSTQLWTITNLAVKRIEITDRSHAEGPNQYIFALNGGQWQMLKPAVARATKRVNDLVAALARLRVTQWVDDDAQAYGTYGLNESAYTIRLTEEIQISPPEDAHADSTQADDTDNPDSTDAQKIETKTTEYVLHLSKQSPIGEDSLVYARTNQGPAVGTIRKSVADKCIPVMSQWRDMKFTQANISSATRVEITTPQGAATLLRESQGWRFDGGGKAETDTVMEMLTSLGELEAVSFVDVTDRDLASFGLDAPQAELLLTIPGQDHMERVTIGSFTDSRAKRLVYAGRNESMSIAKVKIADVQKILRSPRAYRDRTIFNIDKTRFTSLKITTQKVYADQPFIFSYEKTYGQWAMTSPAKHPIRQGQFNSLLDILGNLKAAALVANDSPLTAFGLQTPAIRLDMTCESPDESFTLLIGNHDGQYFAKRADGKAIFLVADAIYKQAMLEYREEKVFDFSEDEVTQFSVSSGETVHEFIRVGEKWTYRWEPDLPLDAAKVKILLLKIRDLRTERFVAHSITNWDTYGLNKPSRLVHVSLGDSKSVTLAIADKICPGDPDKGYYAKIDGSDEVFLIKPSEAARLTVSLDELE